MTKTQERTRQQLVGFLKSWAEDYEANGQGTAATKSPEARAEYARMLRACATYLDAGGDLPSGEPPAAAGKVA